MRLPLALLVACLCAAPAVAQSRSPAVSQDRAGFDLDRYRWRSRVLLLLAPSASDPAYARQRAALDEERAALEARDVVVVSAFEDGRGTVDGRPLPAGSAASLRQRFRAVAGGFAAVLVGKDGGAKLREREPLAPGELFALVDRMPMGREEAASRARRTP